MSEKNKMSPYRFGNGLRDGIPIGLGYLTVAFGFGITAVKLGVSIIEAVLISMTNVTSAGQVAGLSVIVASGGLLEMALTQLVINMRYSLMGISLTQKVDKSFTTLHRMLTSFCITDEIFAVASTKPEPVGRKYFYGLMVFPYSGWALGTLLGGVAGAFLPTSVKNALGIAIYGMFIAIIVPPSKKNRGVLLAVAVAAISACMMRYIPIFSKVSSGFAVIICAIAAAAVASLIFPVGDDEKGGNAK